MASHSNTTTASTVEGDRRKMASSEVYDERLTAKDAESDPGSKPVGPGAAGDQELHEEIGDGLVFEEATFYDKVFMTFAVTYANLCTAVCMRILGPTLLDLGALMNVDPQQITNTLFARALGYFVGAVGSGIVYKYLNRTFVIAVMLYVAGGAIIAMPLLPSTTWLIVLLLVKGFALGLIDPATSTCILDAWGEKSGPCMQILFFGFGLGSLLTPQFVKPFLSPISESTPNSRQVPHLYAEYYKQYHLRRHSGIQDALTILRETWTPHQQDDGSQPESRVATAFYLSAGVCIASGTILMLYLCIRPNVRFMEKAPESVKSMTVQRQSVLRTFTSRNKEERPSTPKPRFSSRFMSERMSQRQSQQLVGQEKPKYGYKKFVLLGAGCINLFVASGMQTCVSIFLVSIAVRYPSWRMTKDAASDLDTVVWAIFTAMRAVVFAVAFFLSAMRILTAGSCVQFLAAVGMFIVPSLALSLVTSQWIFRVVMGLWSLGFAPTIPTTLVFLRNFIKISPAEASALFASLASKDLFPWAVGFVATGDEEMAVVVRIFGALVMIGIAIFVFNAFWGYRVLGTLAAEQEQVLSSRRTEEMNKRSLVTNDEPAERGEGEDYSKESDQGGDLNEGV